MSKCKQCNKRKRHIRMLDNRIRNHNEEVKKLKDKIDRLESLLHFRKNGSIL